MRSNLFQRTMLSWDETLPYNATHALRVERQLEPAALREAIRLSLEHCGYPVAGDAICLEEHAAGLCVDGALRDVVEAQLNRRFDLAAGEGPFRFFVIRVDAATFVLGICYFHPVAGADSILWLLEDVLANYLQRDPKRRIQWSREKPLRCRALLWRYLREIPGWLRSLPGYVRSTRRYARKRIEHQAEAAHGVCTLRLGPDDLDWIRTQMRGFGATFHDVLLALVIDALAKMMPQRLQHPHRREITVGSIINIRNDFGERAANAFGLYLSSFFVSHAVPEGSGFGTVLKDVLCQTRKIKGERLYLRNLLVLQAYLILKRLFKGDRYKKMFLKSFPLLAGVTSFFVDRFQRRLAGFPVSDYWRSASASFATPLVISVTTFGRATNLTITYNRAVYDGREVETLKSLLRKSLPVHRETGVLAVAG